MSAVCRRRRAGFFAMQCRGVCGKTGPQLFAASTTATKRQPVTPSRFLPPSTTSHNLRDFRQHGLFFLPRNTAVFSGTHLGCCLIIRHQPWLAKLRIPPFALPHKSQNLMLSGTLLAPSGSERVPSLEPCCPRSEAICAFSCVYVCSIRFAYI